jgi:hypothetical protein
MQAHSDHLLRPLLHSAHGMFLEVDRGGSDPHELSQATGIYSRHQKDW